MNKNLIEFRNNTELSLSEMAQKIGVSKSYYEKVEYGDRKPGRNFIEKFKSAFPDVSVETIFFA